MPDRNAFKADLAVLLQRHYPNLKGAGPQRLTIDVQVGDHSADIGDPSWMAMPAAIKPVDGHFGQSRAPLTGATHGGKK